MELAVGAIESVYSLTLTLRTNFVVTEELPREKSLRAAHRAGATRIANQVGDLLGAETLDVDELTLLLTNLSS